MSRPPSPSSEELHRMGQMAFTQGQPDQAIAYVQAAIGIKRKEARYHATLALMLNRLGRSAEAEAAARKAIELDRRDAGSHVNLGIALMARGALPDAERALKRALALAPRDPVGLNNMGTVQMRLAKPAAAEPYFRKAVAVNANNAVAWANLAEAAHELDRHGEALAAAHRALAIEPRLAQAHAILGILHMETGAIADALASYQRALALRPGEAIVIGNLGNALVAAGRAEEALTAYDRFLATAPDSAQTIYNKGLTELLLGRLDAGLENYEARLRASDSIPHASDRPWWTENATTQTRLFVWPEQGVGDHLFNASFLPTLLALGTRCIYQCDARLVALLSRSFPDATIIPAGQTPPEHDHQIAAGSLLRALRARSAAPAAPAGWLRADPERVAKFRAHLEEQGPGPRIGISWRSARKTVGPLKSMPLALWGPILSVPGARFVNLQYGDTDAEIAEAAGAAAIHTVQHLDRFDDIDGLVALIACLDMVITTSNVTAHLAGALGRESWVALQKAPLWYWGLDGDNSNYYRSIRLFRQGEIGKWSDVVMSIAAALERRLRSSA